MPTETNNIFTNNQQVGLSVETNLFTKSLSKFFTKFLDKFFEISSTIFVSITLPTLHPKKTNGWWWKSHEMWDLWFQSQFMLHDIQMWKKLTTNKTASFARIWINMLWNLKKACCLLQIAAHPGHDGDEFKDLRWWRWCQRPVTQTTHRSFNQGMNKNSCEIPIPNPASSVAQLP
jgi:hypothetical protein